MSQRPWLLSVSGSSPGTTLATFWRLLCAVYPQVMPSTANFVGGRNFKIPTRIKR